MPLKLRNASGSIHTLKTKYLDKQVTRLGVSSYGNRPNSDDIVGPLTELTVKTEHTEL